MSTKQGYPVRSPQPELHLVGGTLLGTGATAPSIQEGTGFTVTRSGVGVYNIVLDEPFSQMMAMCFTVGSDDPASDIKGYTCHPKTLATNNTINLKLFNASQTADDLEDTWYINFICLVANTELSQ